jgi:hypothetical protein
MPAILQVLHQLQQVMLLHQQQLLSLHNLLLKLLEMLLYLPMTTLMTVILVLNLQTQH